MAGTLTLSFEDFPEKPESVSLPQPQDNALDFDTDTDGISDTGESPAVESPAEAPVPAPAPPQTLTPTPDSTQQKVENAPKGLPILWIVIPCYNEVDVLPATAPLFKNKLEQLVRSGKVSPHSHVCFIDDGSNDGTWDLIQKFAANAPFCGIKLSRNRGHQNALFAGLMEARHYCDAAISIDCDGQDDIDAIDEMVDNFLAGDDVVFGVRSSRESDENFKRNSAEAFYKLMNALGTETIYNHADYRLLSKRALDELANYPERNLFLRGMTPLIGLPSSIVEYERAERIDGESHYPLTKMVGLALDGVTSMSVKPIRIVAGLGVVFSLIGIIGLLWAFFSLIAGTAVSGWASTVVLLSLIGGIQLLGIGVIGEYVGKIYLETKARPRYLVEERTWAPSERQYHG